MGPHPNVELKTARKVDHQPESKCLLNINCSLPDLCPDLSGNAEAPDILFLSCHEVSVVLPCPRQLLQLCCEPLPA